MTTIAQLPQAYVLRRKALAEQLRQATSRSVRDQLVQAVLITDVAITTQSDLLQSLTILTNRQAEALARTTGQATAALEKLDANVLVAKDTESAFERHSAIIQAAFASMRARTAMDENELVCSVSEIETSLLLLLLNSLHDLFAADDRKLFFDRLGHIAAFAVTKLPIVGELFECLLNAPKIYAYRQMQAQEASQYLSSIESYIDACNLYLSMVMEFCERVRRGTSDFRLVTEVDVQGLVAARFQEVIAKVLGPRADS